jgi:hypothetical protein
MAGEASTAPDPGHDFALAQQKPGFAIGPWNEGYVPGDMRSNHADVRLAAHPGRFSWATTGNATHLTQYGAAIPGMLRQLTAQ